MLGYLTWILSGSFWLRNYIALWAIFKLSQMNIKSKYILVIYLQCRLRGKLDTNGVISSLLEERLTPGVTFQLSAEVSLRNLLYYLLLRLFIFYMVYYDLRKSEVINLH